MYKIKSYYQKEKKQARRAMLQEIATLAILFPCAYVLSIIIILAIN